MHSFTSGLICLDSPCSIWHCRYFPFSEQCMLNIKSCPSDFFFFFLISSKRRPENFLRINYNRHKDKMTIHMCLFQSRFLGEIPITPYLPLYYNQISSYFQAVFIIIRGSCYCWKNLTEMYLVSLLWSWAAYSLEKNNYILLFYYKWRYSLG